MKKNLFLLFALAFVALVSFNSCGDSDPCAKKDCVNGTCFDGTCECDAGYEYDADGACTVVSRDKFLHTYTVTEDCSASAPASYTVTIIAGTAINEVNMTNVWNLFTNSVKATIEGNVITIARQEPDADKFFVEGSGTYTTNAGGKAVVTLTYKVTDETIPGAVLTDNCNSTVYTQN